MLTPIKLLIILLWECFFLFGTHRILYIKITLKTGGRVSFMKLKNHLCCSRVFVSKPSLIIYCHYFQWMLHYLYFTLLSVYHWGVWWKLCWFSILYQCIIEESGENFADFPFFVVSVSLRSLVNTSLLALASFIWRSVWKTWKKTTPVSPSKCPTPWSPTEKLYRPSPA